MSVLRHPWIVLACAIAFGLAGAAYSWIRPARYAATAGLVVEDARTSLIFGTRRADDPERYVADQVAFLRSLPLAMRASELAGPEAGISPEDLLAHSTVTSSEASNFISIRFDSSDPLAAQTGANSLALAYRASIAETWQAEARDVLRMADQAIEEAEVDAAALQSQIDASRTLASSSELEGQIPAIEAELAALRDSPLPPEESVPLLDKIERELAARKLLSEIEAAFPVPPLLEQEQRDSFTLLSQLRTRRSQLAADFRVSGDGVALFSPAEGGTAVGIPLAMAVAVGVVMGALVGVASAYWLETRRRRFAGRAEPEAVLRARVLAEIPDFASDGLDTSVPVRDSPRSLAAEAFRFMTLSLATLSHPEGSRLAGEGGEPAPLLTETEREVLEHLSTGFPNRAIASWIGMSNERVRAHLTNILNKLQSEDAARQALSGSTGGEPAGAHAAGSVVAMVSAAAGAGNSTLVANLGWAAAAEGARVLLIDADLAERGLTRLLLGDRGADSGTLPGLMDVAHHRLIGDAAQIVPTADGSDLRILGLGSPTTDPASFLLSPESITALTGLRRHFDLVLIDVPPFLQTAYAGALVREAGLVVVVVRHGSEVRELAELSEKLGLLKTNPAAYVYNHAPSPARSWPWGRTPLSRRSPDADRPGAEAELTGVGGSGGEPS